MTTSTRIAALALATGLAAGGCSGGGGSGRAPEPARTPAPGSSAVGAFRSPRTYQAVPPPIRVRIPAIGVAAALEPRHRAPDGTAEVPTRPDLAGWYADGPRPGQPGPVVLLGHVDWHNGPAVFFRLRDLRRGDIVHVDRADRSTVDYRVTSTTRVPKDRFPTELVFRPSLDPSLRLVTCGGSFDRTTRNYRDNVIVFADPA
jgi:hypothetical protein